MVRLSFKSFLETFEAKSFFFFLLHLIDTTFVGFHRQFDCDLEIWSTDESLGQGLWL